MNPDDVLTLAHEVADELLAASLRTLVSDDEPSARVRPKGPWRRSPLGLTEP